MGMHHYINNREQLDGPAVADFADAETSHAAGVDRERWPHRGLAVRSCRTVFCHSVAGEPAPGAGPADVNAGTLRPGDDPDLVNEALDDLAEARSVDVVRRL